MQFKRSFAINQSKYKCYNYLPARCIHVQNGGVNASVKRAKHLSHLIEVINHDNKHISLSIQYSVNNMNYN